MDHTRLVQLGLMVSLAITLFVTWRSLSLEQMVFRTSAELAENLPPIWMVQVTDLHFSQFRGPDRPTALNRFCSFLAHSVSPRAVIISGDLVDAKDKTGFGSGQYEEEWITYRQTSEECKRILGHNVKWFDLRGNHDNFDVDNGFTGKDYFKEYSTQGARHGRSYLEKLPYGNSSISVVGIDATPVPGPNRISNFFGVMRKNDTRLLHRLIEQSGSSHHTLFFGHYPTSVISTSGSQNMRQILSDQIYLCGHLHTGFGMLTQLYNRHSTGLVELELGDWKDYRRYRIVAFDQGFFSFADASYHEESGNTIIVVTNPKDPRFVTAKEPYAAIRDTKTVRALIFSDIEIETVVLKLPDGDSFSVMTRDNITGGLFTAPWDPSRYKTGLQELKIRVTLSDGSLVEESRPFSLDGSQQVFNSWAAVILSANWLRLTALLFYSLTLLIVIVLVISRITVLGGLSALARVNSIFIPLVASSVYWGLFPWALGQVLNNRLGLIFAWGILLVDDLTFCPPDFSFIIGLLMHITYTIPLILILVRRSTRRTREQKSFCSRCGIFFFCILLCYHCYSISSVYGNIVLLSPMAMGRVALAVYLLKRIRTVST